MKKYLILILTLIITVLGFIGVGCGTPSNPSVTPPDSTVENPTENPSENPPPAEEPNTEQKTYTVTIDNLPVEDVVIYNDNGNQYQLRATATEGAVVEWSSSNTAIAEVDANGLVTFKADGEFNVTAKIKDQTASDSGTINCKKRTIEILNKSAIPATIDIYNAPALTLTYKVEPQADSGIAVEWTSSDESVATVNNGVLTFIDGGSTTITVKEKDSKIVYDSVIITVLNDAEQVAETEMTGAYVGVIDAVPNGTFTAKYTKDENKLPVGATVGINVKATFSSDVTHCVRVPLSATIENGKSYKVSFMINLENDGTSAGGNTNTYWLINFSDSVSGKTNYKALKTVSAVEAIRDEYDCEYTFTSAAETTDSITLYLTLSPDGSYDNLDFTISKIKVEEVVLYDELPNVARNINASVVQYVENGENKKKISITGINNVANNSLVDIKTDYDLTADTEYVLSYKFNVKNAVQRSGAPKLGYGFYFSHQINPTLNATFGTTMTIGEDQFGVGSTLTDWVNRCSTASMSITPTANITDFYFRILIQGTFFDSFDIEVSDIQVIEKAKINQHLAGATQNSTWVNWNFRGSHYLKDISGYTVQKGGVDLDIGKTIIVMEADEASTENPRVDFGLTNATWETGKTYNISFKIIDFNIFTSGGNYWWTHVGIVGESVGGTSNMTSLQAYRTGGYVTTEDITINGVAKKLFTINIEYNATVTKTPPSLRVLLGKGYTQQIGITDISITEKVSG